MKLKRLQGPMRLRADRVVANLHSRLNEEVCIAARHDRRMSDPRRKRIRKRKASLGTVLFFFVSFISTLA